MASSSSKRNSVKKTTFLKWSKNEDFDYEVDDDDYLTILKCKICTIHLAAIRQEAKTRGIRGTALKSLLTYTEGVSYIHKSNFDKHVKSGSLHDFARTLAGSASSSARLPKDQTTIEDSCSKSNNQLYSRLMRTALHIAMKEKPYADFPGLIDLQRSNGLKMMAGKSHNKACAEFIENLAAVVRNDLKEMLKTSNFCSAMFDGSQPRKTFSEKELLYVKICIRGQAIELLLKCMHMNDYGTGANDLKRAFDETFLQDYSLELEQFTSNLVCVCADGASINMGRYNGVATQIKRDDRKWLLIIHCSKPSS